MLMSKIVHGLRGVLCVGFDISSKNLNKGIIIVYSSIYSSKIILYILIIYYQL